MENTCFKIGDIVYHTSNEKIKWTVMEVEDNKIRCKRYDEKEKKFIIEDFQSFEIKEEKPIGFYAV